MLFLREDAVTERTNNPICTCAQQASRNLITIETMTHWYVVTLQTAIGTSSQTKTIISSLDSTLSSKHRKHDENVWHKCLLIS